jgi:hypothetical protein
MLCEPWSMRQVASICIFGWFALFQTEVGSPDPVHGELLTHSKFLRLRASLFHLSRSSNYEDPFSGEAGLRISTGSRNNSRYSESPIIPSWQRVERIARRGGSAGISQSE